MAEIRAVLVVLLGLAGACRCDAQAAPSVDVRFATFNVEDVRRSDIEDPSHPRLRRIASIIRDLRPNVILLNEIAYDGAGSPGFKDGDEPGLPSS